MDACLQLSLLMPVMTSNTEPMKNLQVTDTTVAMNSPWRWSVPLLALLALLILLVSGYNVALFSLMNRFMSYASDSLWVHLSLVGDGLFIVLLVLPFLGRRPDIVWQYVIATILGGLFVYGMKEIFSALRPPAVLLSGSFHLIGPALQNNAFPSGHSTALFVVAGLVALQQVRNWFKWVVLFLAVFVGLSRIASGVHWPLDVLGAATGGWLIAILSVWISLHWRAGINIWPQRIFALILAPLSVWAVWTLWPSYDSVYPGTGLLQVSTLTAGMVLAVPGLLRLLGIRRASV